MAMSDRVPPAVPALPVTNEPIAYASPASLAQPLVPHAEKTPTFSWGMFLWSGLVLTTWMALIVFVIPPLRQTFDDFQVELPFLTRAVFALPKILTHGGYVPVIAVAVAIGFFAARLEATGKRLLRLGVTLLLAFLVVLTVAGLGQPMITLIDGISSATGKPPVSSSH